MDSRRHDALWMGSAFCMSFALAVAVLLLRGVNERGIDLALAATARFAFLLFWLS